MSPEEDRTRDAVDSEPKHYQLSYSGPPSVYNLILKSIGGMESEPMLTPREKFPLQVAQRRAVPTTLHHAGQQAKHTTD